jgi:hypothetical protein
MKRSAEHNSKIAAGVNKHWQSKPTARMIAREAGEKFFVPDVPCERGHRLRYVKDGWCVECARLEGRRPELRFKRILHNAKGGAREENVPFNLDEDYIKEIWPVDNLCPIMGTLLTEATGPFRRGPRTFSPSIDRFIPKLGYVRGNVSIISHFANKLKNNCTDPQVFRRLADWMENKRS